MWANMFPIIIKVKVRVHVFTCSLISSLKIYHPTLHFTGPVHSCAISTPRRAYNPAAISAHWTYRTHCHLCPTRTQLHLSQVKHLTGSALSMDPTSRQWPKIQKRETLYFPENPAQEGYETAWQTATSAKRHVLTIAPCPSHKCLK